MPLFTVSCRSMGAVPVIVTVPGAMQVAVPPSIVAMAVLEVFQERPSTPERVRVVLLVNVPCAEKPTVACVALDAVAVDGLTATAVSLA